MTLAKTFISTFLGTVLQTSAADAIGSFKIMIAAYFDPTDQDKWNAILRAAKRFPVTVIIKPHAITSKSIQDWSGVINLLHSNSLQVLTCIDLDSGHAQLATIQAHLDAVTLFPTDGFFFDRFPTSHPHLHHSLEIQAILDLVNQYCLPGRSLIIASPSSQKPSNITSYCSDVVVTLHDPVSPVLDLRAKPWKPLVFSDSFLNHIESIADPIAAYAKLAAKHSGSLYINATSFDHEETISPGANSIDANNYVVNLLNRSTRHTFGTPVVNYKITATQHYEDRPLPLLLHIKSSFLGGPTKAVDFQFRIELDGRVVSDYAQNLPVFLEEIGLHTLKIFARSKFGATSVTSSQINVSTGQVDSHLITVYHNRAGQGVFIRAASLHPKKRLKSVDWYLNGKLQPMSRHSFHVRESSDGSFPQVHAHVQDATGLKIRSSIDLDVVTA